MNSNKSLTPGFPSPATLHTPLSNLTSNDLSTSAHSWEHLRKQARQFENELEQKLTSYSKIAAQVGRSVGDSKGEDITGNSSEAMELELEELIKKLTSVVNSMAEVVDKPSATPTNPSMMHMLQRHRDILYDYSKEFKKTKANIQAAKNHSDLLSSVREDISSFKSGISSETDYFLGERGRIESSHRMTDMIIEQAYETREEIGRQRNILLNMNSRMNRLTNMFPAINSLIGKINLRKRRDTIILAFIISFCIILIFLYMRHTSS
ncbi:Golgi SNAP receptor complex member 1-like [Rhizophagus clarus]|uniref:Golgi SNAP receptor complex member 1-like n=2 Tax=Rhizophagus clarus TaxID=94130 RepID=A0A8H3LFN5_9GLOM|nr:Golgi SNAP receptor complex member 1-like [Rhizophagus clarus]